MSFLAYLHSPLDISAFGGQNDLGTNSVVLSCDTIGVVNVRIGRAVTTEVVGCTSVTYNLCYLNLRNPSVNFSVGIERRPLRKKDRTDCF